MEIEGWLHGLGLDRYAALFHANDIGLDVLSELTDADLTTLGISLGDRKRLLRAVARLSDPAASPARPAAERRQLTVLFVDLVGSTALSARLDPEELREVMQAYQATVAREIGRFEGHIAKFMGDGVLAYFGWPTAHEDEAERAVRAGLAAIAAVARLSLPGTSPLAARVGIATGMVIVGDLVGEGAAQEEAVVGETPNLAARLQALAEPGAVVVADHTRRLLGQLFEFVDLGPRQLAGFDGPVAAFRAVRARAGSGRFEALRGQNLTPLVGRDDIIAMLLERWRHAREGVGQVVLLVGEPGIGKSRLLQALGERLSDEPHRELRYYCSPFHPNTAFHPVLDQIEQAAGLDRDDPEGVKLDKLELSFGLGGGQAAEATALTATLMGIPTAGRYPPSSLGPQGLKAKLQEIWLRRLEVLAAERTLLILLEDAHWIDPSSSELFGLLVACIRQLPALLVATSRPEPRPEWWADPSVTVLPVERFGAREGLAIVERVAGGRAMPRELRDEIVAKADGVPLFLEELTKAVEETGLVDEAVDRGRAGGPHLLAIPSTLQDSLLARLDRLSSPKVVAQTAAAIGREFERDLLSVVVELDETSLDAALARLAAAGIIFPRGEPLSASYVFKHALVQDAAYASLLRGPRQAIHARIATALDQRGAGCPPALLAHHLALAGQADRSVDLLAQAGQEAVARAASKEAVVLFRQALAQLLSLPETPERRRREAVLQGALGAALVHVTGPASEPLAHAYARARDLCRETGDSKAQFIAEWNLWHHFYARAEYGDAQTLADHLMASAEREQDQDLLLQACHVEWVALGSMTDYAATLACCERGWALYDPDRHGAHAFTFGAHDPGVCSRNHAAQALWFLGRPDRALACHEQALALARKLDHPVILVNALARGLPLLQRLRDRDRLVAQADATIALATEQGFPNYRIDAEILRAWALRDDAEPGATTRLIQDALVERQRLNSMWLNPYFLSLLADEQIREGALADALVTIECAMKEAQTKGHLGQDLDLVRMKGEILTHAGDLVAAEACLASALATARATSARLFELRSATSLARLWAAHGQAAAARQLLGTVYHAFDEGFGTPDLRDAGSLLASLEVA